MGFSLASIITASLGNGPRGRELARAEAAKNDSPTIPEASAAVPATPNCRKFLREAPLPLHRELLSMISPPAILQDLGLAKPLSRKRLAPSKNASGKRCALAGSIISEIAELEDDLQPQLHVEGFSRTESGSTIPVADGVGSDAEAAADGIAHRRQ